MDIFSGALGAVLAVLLLTSFVKLLTALNILRYGFGLSDGAFGIVIIAVSLALTCLVYAGKIEQGGGIEALLKNAGSGVGVDKNFRPFLEQHTDAEVLKRMNTAAIKIQKKEITQAQSPKAEGTSFPVLLASFLLSELKGAFMLGLMFLIPFVVIDIAVANILMALGVVQMSPGIIAMPLKLLLFVAVNGWTLVAEKLLGTYAL